MNFGYAKMPLSVRIAQLLNMLNTENRDKIHYTEIATKLNISTSSASQLAKAVAAKHPKTWRYESGWLLRVDVYGKPEE